MIDKEFATRVAHELMLQDRHPDDPEMVIDTQKVEHFKGHWIIPYNSPEYIASRNEREMLLDCWPILVDSESGSARKSTIEDLDFLGDNPED
ncbi:YrhB domain-containing protein [Streptomyces sp. NP-1717]|uniref:YrhB domain-containing protein n=1 Tax=unclassified Streptomyces TaxID=2593676 RepID=UPI001F5D6E21|nr:YrhB domain-containing protein [Streptomyces sp. NP-1717]MCI3225727.1 hypothetical protein [Streptomyces sp. NP-1717]WTA74021.1 YrhB domain-containing protein [Streptomyces sp. NBC_00838]